MTPNTLPLAEENRCRDQLGFMSDRMDEIVRAADGRDLTKAQARDFEQLHKESRRLLGLIGERPSLFELPEGTKAATEVARSLHDWASQPAGGPEPRAGRPSPGGFQARELVSVLRPEQRLAEHVPPGAPGVDLSMGRFVRAIVTGDWSGIDPEARAMSVGTAGAGGYLVPDPLSARVIDQARNAAQVFRAGALTVPMDSSTLKIARVAEGPDAEWKLENAALTASDMTLESVTLTAHTLMALVKGSVELFEDAKEITNTIETSLAAALALELDRAALRGSGTDPEPRGIRNTSGVTIQSMGTNGLALTNYDPISTAVQTIQQNNGDPNAVIYSPRTSGVLDRLKDTTNQPLRPPPSVEALRRLVSAQLPNDLTQGSSSVASEAYVGQWNELLVGMRTQLTIEASREAGDASGGAFTSLQVWVRAYLRADIAVAQPSHFVVITGIL